MASTVVAVRLDDGRTVVARSGITAAAAAHEAFVLEQLQQTPVPAPEVLAVGDGMLLMTRMPGRVDLQPRDPESWIRQLAAMLPVIHALPIDGGPFEPWIDLARADDQHLAAIAADASVEEQCFIHRDYQHFNVLWSRGQLTSVVDWTWASNGHPDVDTGHCRINLALLYSVEVAERFRLAYEAEAGRAVDPLVDLRESLAFGPGWEAGIARQAIGFPLDVAGGNERIAELRRSILRRAG